MAKEPMTAGDRPGRAHGLGPGPVIVLVDPQMGENIGAAARAMLNFGLTRLRLVRPRDGWPNPKAGAMAAGASSVVDHARVFDTVEEATADCHFTLATTARQRELYLPVFDPAAAAREMKPRVDEGETCAILFGGEKSGLATDDIALAHGILTIPVNPDFSSLNLGQAVLLAAWEWSKAAGKAEGFASKLERAVPAPQEDVDGLLGHLFAELEPAGYFFPPEKRAVMERNIRTAIKRASFTKAEAQLLRGIVKALAKGRGKGRV